MHGRWRARGSPWPARDAGPPVVRCAASTVVLLAILLSPFPLVALLLAWRGGDAGGAALLAAGYLGFLLWMGSHRVELAPGRLVHRTLLGATEYDVTGLAAVRIVVVPSPTLVLRARGARERVTAFRVKPFTRNGVAAVLQHVRASSPRARFDRLADGLRAGDVERLPREAARTAWVLRILVAVGGAAALALLVRARLR